MRFAIIAAIVAVQSSLHAAWCDLKPGFDAGKTIAAIGRPLLVSKSRGYETWVYDRGGCAAFEGGRLVYWRPPKPSTPSPASDPR